MRLTPGDPLLPGAFQGLNLFPGSSGVRAAREIQCSLVLCTLEHSQLKKVHLSGPTHGQRQP